MGTLYYSEAERYYFDGNFRESLTQINQSLYYRPDWIQATIKYGDILLKDGLEAEAREKYNEAVKKYKSILRRNPDSYKLFSKIGGVYIKLEKYDDAIIEYEKGAASDPGNFEDAGGLYELSHLKGKASHSSAWTRSECSTTCWPGLQSEQQPMLPRRWRV